MVETRTTLDGEALLRINQAVERFEDHWRRGEPRLLEDLVRGEQVPGARLELLRYALAVELKYRRDRGEMPTVAEYERRFPEHGEVVRAGFGELETLMPPTRLVDRTVPVRGRQALRTGKFTAAREDRQVHRGDADWGRGPGLDLPGQRPRPGPAGRPETVPCLGPRY